MRQWRVGSFSMGLILVFLGAGLIVDHFSLAHKALDLVIIWWPLALILFGAEILASGFLSRNEQFKIKYDGWSIFLMIILFFFCLGSYTLSYSGVLPQIREALAFSDYPCSIPDQEISLVGINKVIISSRGGELELHNTPDDDKMTILGQATIPAATGEAAGKLAEQGQAEIKKVGDSLFVQINHVPGQNNIFRHRLSESGRAIFIPADITLEVTGSGYDNSITLSLDSLNAGWTIDNSGPVRVNLSPDLDVLLSGSVSWSRSNLTGNIDWEYTTEEEDPDSYPHQRASGKFRLGRGSWPLVISSSQTIEANIRKVQ